MRNVRTTLRTLSEVGRTLQLIRTLPTERRWTAGLPASLRTYYRTLANRANVKLSVKKYRVSVRLRKIVIIVSEISPVRSRYKHNYTLGFCAMKGKMDPWFRMRFGVFLNWWPNSHAHNFRQPMVGRAALFGSKHRTIQVSICQVTDYSLVYMYKSGKFRSWGELRPSFFLHFRGCNEIY